MKATMSVAESLKRFRAHFKLTQDVVANETGMLQQTWYKYESGRNIPSAAVIVKVARTFNVSADYLLGLIDEPRPWQVADSKATVSAGDLEARVSRLEAAVAALQAKGDSSAGDDIAQPVSSPV